MSGRSNSGPKVVELRSTAVVEVEAQIDSAADSAVQKWAGVEVVTIPGQRSSAVVVPEVAVGPY